jgi:hypothetical protein
MALKVRVLKSGKQQFYNGRNKATKAEKKEFLRANKDTYQKGTEDYNKLSTTDKKTVAGIKRQDTSLKVKGKFVPKEYEQKFIKNLNQTVKEKRGIDLEAIARFKGMTVQQVIQEDSELSKELNEAFKVGLPRSYNGEKIPTVLQDFESKGYKIFINDTEISALDAIDFINDYFMKLRRELQNFSYSVVLTDFGASEIRANLPDLPEDTDEYDDFIADNTDNFEIYGSP